mgnify:CR=1 FL=1
MAYPMFPQNYPQNYPQLVNANNNLMSVNNNFLIVKTEQEVLNYPVGCGNSVNFKIENAPYLYTKTMGFSQFDKPVIEKYRLLKEELGGTVEETRHPLEEKINSFQSTIDSLENKIAAMQNEINSLRERRNKNEHNANGKSV